MHCTCCCFQDICDCFLFMNNFQSEMKNDNKVLIFLSLYNGEKYIKEQLDSLLSQTVPVMILARDDGSTDNTVKIVDEYINNHENIMLIKGSNLGFVRSFNSLLSENIADDYEWFAFCDQDDVWLPDKLEKAISKLKQTNDTKIPLMYCSNLIIVDEKLEKIGMMHHNLKKVLNSCIFVENWATGCTVVFNKSALYEYRNVVHINMIAHDYTMLCICKYFGHVFYDFNSYILYRQHGNNVYGSGSVTYLKGFRNILRDLVHPKIEKRRLFFKDFIDYYKDKIHKTDFMFLNRFVNYKKHFNRLYLMIDPKVKGFNKKATIAFKARLLAGRMY